MIVLLKVEIVKIKNITSFKLELGRTSHALPLLMNSHLQQEDVFLLLLQQEEGFSWPSNHSANDRLL